MAFQQLLRRSFNNFTHKSFGATKITCGSSNKIVNNHKFIPLNQRKFSSFSETTPYFDGLLQTEFTNKLDINSKSPVIPIFHILNSDGTLESGWEAPFNKKEVIDIYKFMVKLSIWDSFMYNIQRQGRISFYIQNAGEEALQTGIGAALTLNDSLWCQYRELGVLMWRDFSLADALNQLFGNQYDQGKGRQMPISYSKKEINLPPIATPLASQIPHASGAGYGHKILGQDACAVAFFGEGAASEGDFHAALNFAATLKSQTIFVCRNNGYAISTPVSEQYAGDGIAIRGIAYGMPTIRVDGNDIFASYMATKKAREICIGTSQPVCMEFMTYRVGHHSTSDESSQYRIKGQMESWSKDGLLPIARLKNYLMLNGYWSEDEDKELNKEARAYVLKQIKEAEVVKKLDITEGIFEDVYSNKSWNIKEQEEEFTTFLNNYKSNYDLTSFKGL